MVKVIVTGAGALLGQVLIRTLKQISFPVEIVTLDPSPLSVGHCWGERAYQIPMANDPAYLEVLCPILERERADALLIGTDVELHLFARERATLEREFAIKILVSSPEVVDIADDKWLTYQFLKENDLPHPQSRLPGDEDALIDAVGFPLVVKPRRGARSYGLSVVHDREALHRAIAAQPDLIIQECVGSDDVEYTAGVLHFQDRCDASIVMRRDLRDGNTARGFVDSYPELNQAIRAMASRLKPFGPANFQFRVDQGVPKVFEINGRFSGTTSFRALAGFNEVEMALRHLLWDEPVTQPVITPKIVLRYFDELAIDPT